MIISKKKTKKDIVFLLSFIAIFMIISRSGLIKYLVLSAGIVVAFLFRKKQRLEYYQLLLHAAVYSSIGVVMALVSGNFSFNSIKQLLIYFCSGLFAITFFSLYGTNNSCKLVDIQFVALCIAYICLFGRNLSIHQLYFESNIYAYIFAVYGLLYFWQNRYKAACVAAVFMLIDHKRIATYSFILCCLVMFFVKRIKKDKKRKWISRIAAGLLLVVPFVWVYLCSNGMLISLFSRFHINTMGRLEGTGAWNIVREYYVFSPGYLGKGIGWVLEWLENANIASFSNLHNDFLAAYIELGCLGFLLWVVSFQLIPKKIGKEDRSIQNLVYIIMGFMFMNLLTDNIYLYVTFMLPLYTVLLSLLYGEDRKSYSKDRLI